MNERKAPARIFIDPRVAATLPETLPDGGAALGPGGVKSIEYIHGDVVREQIRAASNVGEEIIIMIQTVGDVIHGLSNQGRLWAFGVVAGGETEWHLIAGNELNS
jgi:hypothetical protein